MITHGFFQDVSGRKMSKSLGNVVEPQELIRRYGADILRLWVFSLDYRDDTPISEEILARCAEAYRKIRNTARYLISNLYDFSPARARGRDGRAHAARPVGFRPSPATSRHGSAKAYDAYEFHLVYHLLVNFCATTLSAFYLDILKDRLYASRADSPGAARRADGDEPDRPRDRDAGRARCSPSPPRRSGRRFRERRKNRSTSRVSRP